MVIPPRTLAVDPVELRNQAMANYIKHNSNTKSLIGKLWFQNDANYSFGTERFAFCSESGYVRIAHMPFATMYGTTPIYDVYKEFMDQICVELRQIEDALIGHYMVGVE